MRSAGVLRRPLSIVGSHKILLGAVAGVVVIAVAGFLLWTMGFLGGGGSAVNEDRAADDSPRQSTEERGIPPEEPAYAVTAIPGIPECDRPASASEDAPEWEVSEIEAAALTGVVQVLTDIGGGSGFIANEDGIIVTDSQVVGGSWLIRVRLADGKTVNGELFGINERLGVAYIEVDNSEGLAPIPMGDSDDVCIGDAAFAAGFPSAADGAETSPSITQGLISSNRGGFFRTDVSLQSGNVGGPLLNAAGRVVGINSSGIVVAAERSSSASNFAIPINDVKLQIADGLDREQLSSGVRLPQRPTDTPQPVATVKPTPIPAQSQAVAASATPVPTPTVIPQPSPTATPRPTPRPTATPRPTPRPTATPRPTPRPTATPRPRPTQRPTATPRPTPTRRPTATPRPTLRPTAVPTRIPRPTATPALPPMQEYRNERSGYSLEYPTAWRVDQEAGGVVVLRSADGAAFIEILSEPISRDWSLGEFTESHRLRVSRRASSWDLYQELSIRGEFRGATNYIHQEFRRREMPGNCIENGVSHMYRSRYFPARLQGFVVTMSICEDSVRAYGPSREAILSSFEEFQTN